MKELLWVSVSQFGLVFLKHYNVRLIAARQALKSSLITVGIQLTWLVSSALGIHGFLQNDWLVVVVYILSGALGSYLSFKLKITNEKYH